MPGKRLTFSQRIKLQVFLEDHRCKSLKIIAETLKVNRVTLYKEILNRRIQTSYKEIVVKKGPEQPCKLLEKFPFCCNACRYRPKCVHRVFIYDAYSAHENFSRTKYNCSTGPSMSENELDELDKKVSPRVLMGQSLYHIKASDNTIKVSQQTLRRYIQKGYLKCKPIDLPRTVQRRHNDFVIQKRTHIDPKLLVGRTFEDFKSYASHSSTAKIIQIDTVYGKLKDDKVILTIFEPKSKLQFGILIPKTSETVNKVILSLIEKFDSINKNLFDVILTDNGKEFIGLPQIQINEDGEYRFMLFYCDPYCSWQKGGCERNHELFRYVKRKGITLDTVSQPELNQIFSNINSLKRKSLNGLSPYDVFAKTYGYEALELIGITNIKPHNIILKN